MSAVYEYIGRIVVRITWLYYGRRIKLVGALTAALFALVGGYLVARRVPPEG